MAELKLLRVDGRREDARTALEGLRQALRGDVVSPAGRRRTIEVFGEPLTPLEVAARICQDVRQGGVKSLLDYTRRLDQVQLTPATLRVPPAALAKAHAAADPEFLATVRRIRARIDRFQTAILHRDVEVALAGGGFLRQRYVPLERVGLCVPGGAAAYPSTVLMTAVPAHAAGVTQLAVVAPPTASGSYNPQVLATCQELGITEVYRMGGAQAVAALAYGVEGVRPVDKIVGPGNLFVALAKKIVFGQVDIDSVAGPSEVVVIADQTYRPELAAADMIAQAEHAPGSSILVSWHQPLCDAVGDCLQEQLVRLPRGDLARESLEAFGAVVLVADAAEAVRLANFLAPEHLQVVTEDPAALLPSLVHAGAIFLGRYSPVALGDYTAGPSHVLPTGGTARFASGLSANDFLRAGSVIRFSADSLAETAADVRIMAEVEGLTAHWQSVELRLEKGESS